MDESPFVLASCDVRDFVIIGRDLARNHTLGTWGGHGQSVKGFLGISDCIDVEDAAPMIAIHQSHILKCKASKSTMMVPMIASLV